MALRDLDGLLGASIFEPYFFFDEPVVDDDFVDTSISLNVFEMRVDPRELVLFVAVFKINDKRRERENALKVLFFYFFYFNNEDLLPYSKNYRMIH